MENFSLGSLIPDLCHFPWLGGLFCRDIAPNPAETVSICIVGFLILCAVYSAVIVWKRFSQSVRHISFYKDLLKDIKQEELAQQRNEIKRKSQEYPLLGRIWEEFDESLVLHKTANGEYRLFNTLDAAHFFNTHTLAEGLTENRLLAAVPSLLVAIGVIGTFAGLQMGLAGVDLGSGELRDVKEGIYGMLSGASIAFQSSLWGIALSVLFNLFEKYKERKVRANISEIQNRVDFLYPRINPEQMLVEIADASKQGTETMQGLAEQIGNKMQEAVIQSGESFGNALKENLHEILAPALEKIAVEAKTGSEKALESMLERFMDGFGKAGEDQRDMMDKSSNEVHRAVGEFGEGMARFLERLDERAKDIEEKNLARNEQFGTLVRDYEARGEERQAKMSAQFEALMNEIGQGIKEQMDTQRQLDQERGADAQRRMEEMRSSQENLNQQIQSIIRDYEARGEERQAKMSAQFEALMNEIGQGIKEQMDTQRQLDQERGADAQRRMEEMRSSQENLNQQIQSIIRDYEARGEERQAKMSAQFEALMNEIGQGIKEQMDTQRQLDQERGADAQRRMEEMRSSQENLSRQLQSMLSYQEESHGRLYEKLLVLSDGFERISSTNQSAAEDFKTSSEKMRQASSQLSDMSAEMNKASDSLSEAAGRMARSGDEMVKVNLEAVKRSEEVLERYRSFAEEMRQTSETLRLAAQHAEKGFESVDESLNGFQKSMRSHVENMREQMRELMENFAESVKVQTTERFREWNSQTAEYISTMTNAVNAIADVVDDIESKTDRDSR